MLNPMKGIIMRRHTVILGAGATIATIPNGCLLYTSITRLDHSIQRIWKQRINAITRKEKLLF